MIRNITFAADDLVFIENLVVSGLPKLTPFIEHLKDEVKDLVADDTICLELSEELIDLSVVAERELEKSDSGILNHIAIQFFHNC